MAGPHPDPLWPARASGGHHRPRLLRPGRWYRCTAAEAGGVVRRPRDTEGVAGGPSVVAARVVSSDERPRSTGRPAVGARRAAERRDAYREDDSGETTDPTPVSGGAHGRRFRARCGRGCSASYRHSRSSERTAPLVRVPPRFEHHYRVRRHRRRTGTASATSERRRWLADWPSADERSPLPESSRGSAPGRQSLRRRPRRANANAATPSAISAASAPNPGVVVEVSPPSPGSSPPLCVPSWSVTVTVTVSLPTLAR